MGVDHGRLGKEKDKIITFETYRRVLKISWIGRQKIEEILLRAGESKNFLRS